LLTVPFAPATGIARAEYPPADKGRNLRDNLRHRDHCWPVTFDFVWIFSLMAL